DGLSAPPELRWSCQAHANLPPLGPSRRTPNQGPFPLHPFCCRVDPNGTVDPSDTPRCFRLIAEVRAATPRSTGSSALRRALCRRATPTTPVSDPAVMGRLLRRDPSAFPVRMAGRRSQRPFRGLLGLHSHCGPSTRRPTPGGPLFRELQRFGCPPRRLGSYRDVPTTSRTGLSPARDTAPQRGAHSNPCFSRDHVFARLISMLQAARSEKADETKTAARSFLKSESARAPLRPRLRRDVEQIAALGVTLA